MARPLLKSSASHAGIDWTGLFKMLVLQVAVLLVLAAAAITYLNWTSDAALVAFMSASEPARPEASLLAQRKQVASAKQQCEKRQ